jgi:hypothetical protein
VRTARTVRTTTWAKFALCKWPTTSKTVKSTSHATCKKKKTRTFFDAKRLADTENLQPEYFRFDLLRHFHSLVIAHFGLCLQADQSPFFPRSTP